MESWRYKLSTLLSPVVLCNICSASEIPRQHRAMLASYPNRSLATSPRSHSSYSMRMVYDNCIQEDTTVPRSHAGLHPSASPDQKNQSHRQQLQRNALILLHLLTANPAHCIHRNVYRADTSEPYTHLRACAMNSVIWKAMPRRPFSERTRYAGTKILWASNATFP